MINKTKIIATGIGNANPDDIEIIYTTMSPKQLKAALRKFEIKKEGGKK